MAHPAPDRVVLTGLADEIAFRIQAAILEGEITRTAGDLPGEVGGAEQCHHGLPAGGPGQFVGLADQFERRVRELAAEVVGQHENVVRHRSPPA